MDKVYVVTLNNLGGTVIKAAFPTALDADYYIYLHKEHDDCGDYDVVEVEYWSK